MIDPIKEPDMKRNIASTAAITAVATLLIACAGLGDGQNLHRYRCENDISFSVKFVDNSAIVEGSRGYDVLFRDAGGLAPGQQVFSNPRMRVEFGLGPSGREAIVRYPLLPLVARCARD
jgi:hypothetical protein